MAVSRDVTQAVKYLTNWQAKGAAANATLGVYLADDPKGTRFLGPDAKAWAEMGEYLDKLKAALGVAAVLLALLLCAAPAQAFDPAGPTQHGTLTNTETVSAAGATAVKTITGVSFKQARVYSLTARCTATFASVRITNAGTQVWSTDTSFVSSNTKVQTFPVPYTGDLGATMVVTLGPCAPGDIATLDVQADLY